MTEEQVIITSDGVLSRASKAIAFKHRARRILVHSRVAAKEQVCIDIQVGTSGRLSWREDWGKPILKNGEWQNMFWEFHDPFAANTVVLIDQDLYRAVTPAVARTAELAVVEHARLILNHWLLIRPLVTADICDTLTKAIARQWKGEKVWRAVKPKPEPAEFLTHLEQETLSE